MQDDDAYERNNPDGSKTRIPLPKALQEDKMVDNQHKQIKGYRDLSTEEIALMNDAKSKAEDIGKLIDVLKDNPIIDKRWLAIAQTDLQKGFMSLIRAIAQPTTF